MNTINAVTKDVSNGFKFEELTGFKIAVYYFLVKLNEHSGMSNEDFDQLTEDLANFIVGLKESIGD